MLSKITLFSLIPLIFLGLGFCSTDEKYTCSSLTPGIDFEIKIDHEENHEVSLILKMTSKNDLIIEIDGKAFASDCYYFRDDSLLQNFVGSRKRDLCELSKLFKYNQAIVENDKGELKLFSVESNFRNGPRPLMLTNCMDDWTIRKRLQKETSIEIILDHLDLDDFKINPNDTKVRLYYLKKNDPQGGPSLILCSNWLLL